MAFKVEVPIDVGGGGKSGKEIGEKIAEGFLKQTKSLAKSAGTGAGSGGGTALMSVGTKMLGWVAIIGMAIDAIWVFIKPIFSLLKVLIMLLFLPLVPILKPLLMFLAAFVKMTANTMKILMGYVQKLVNMFGEGVTWIWENILKPVWEGLVKAFEIFKEFGIWLWENIFLPGFNNVLEFGLWIWNLFAEGFNIVLGFGMRIWEEIIQPAWFYLIDVGFRIWNEIIQPAWLYLKDVGKWVWNVIKSPWEWLAGKIRSIWSMIKSAVSNMIPKFLRGGDSKKDDFISRPGQNPVSFNPSDTIIGVKDISKLGGGGSIVVNINNPSVRQSSDIKNIANEVSLILQRQTSRRISSG